MNALNTMKLQATAILEEIEKIEEIKTILTGVVLNVKVEGQTWVFPPHARVQVCLDRLSELLNVNDERLHPQQNAVYHDGYINIPQSKRD